MKWYLGVYVGLPVVLAILLFLGAVTVDGLFWAAELPELLGLGVAFAIFLAWWIPLVLLFRGFQWYLGR